MKLTIRYQYQQMFLVSPTFGILCTVLEDHACPNQGRLIVICLTCARNSQEIATLGGALRRQD